MPVPGTSIVVEAAGLMSYQANSFGGLDLNRQSDHSAACTTGFSVEKTDGSGTNGVLTAGHCPNALEFNSGDDLTFQSEVQGGDWDTQWHLTPGYDDQPWVRDGGTSYRVVTDRVARSGQSVGDYVCLSKRDDTVKCGLIQSKTFDPGAGYNATFIRVDGGSVDLSVGGDSGGPWWLGSCKAYGTHMGSVTADPNDAVYMAQNLITTMGVRVKISP